MHQRALDLPGMCYSRCKQCHNSNGVDNDCNQAQLPSRLGCLDVMRVVLRAEDLQSATKV